MAEATVYPNETTTLFADPSNNYTEGCCTGNNTLINDNIESINEDDIRARVDSINNQWLIFYISRIIFGTEIFAGTSFNAIILSLFLFRNRLRNQPIAIYSCALAILDTGVLWSLNSFQLVRIITDIINCLL